MEQKQGVEMIEELQEARRLLAKGWCQRTMHRRTIFGGHKYCAEGALTEAFYGYPTASISHGMMWDAYRLVVKALAGELGVEAPRYGGMIPLNDLSITRKQDVLRAFDVAIKAAISLAQPEVIKEPKIELPTVTKELANV